MAEPLFINELLIQILKGNIRIPSFQRGFVWDADRVAHLMDSIYKGFPFGSLLFWRTKTALNTEKSLGPYKLPNNDPDYPIDYILDGQQRATSIFGVFQTELLPDVDEDAACFDIYFDLTQEATIQDSNFIYLPRDEFKPYKHFPLKLLFNPPEYRKFLKTMDDSIADKVDLLYQRFTTARIPVQTFSTDDRTAVAIVFERINRLGIELDTLQLLSAWTWNEEFDLKEKFSGLAEDLEPFGFKNVGEDSDLLLRCCAAIIADEASPTAIISLNGTEVRERFQEICKGILGAVDFLKNNFKAYSAAVLPFPSIIIPLSVFFSTENDQSTNPTSDQQEILEKWVWRTFFSRRYSKRLEQLNTDVKEIKKLKSEGTSALGNFDVEFDNGFFCKTQFNLNTVNTKTFILMLASESPLNFVSGSPVSLGDVLRACNKKEFHHVYPKKYLTDENVSVRDINCLTNYVILSKAENNKIGGLRPSLYRKMMSRSEEIVSMILKKALCPEDIFHDDFGKFIKERDRLLVEKAKKLMRLS